MKILSPAFKHNEKISPKYTCDGQGINPPLTVQGVPGEAKSLVLISDDPDAPSGTFVHWIVFNIDPKATVIVEDEKRRIGKMGINSAGQPNYYPPCPPSGTHRYFFKLFALDIVLNLPEGVDKLTVENAIKGHILESAELIGTYQRS